MATPITPLDLTSATWSTFGTAALRTNELITRANNLGTSEDISITGGQIDGVEIGNVTPVTGVFSAISVVTEVDLSTATLILADNQISGDAISGGVATLETLELIEQPSADSHATTKLYVDTKNSTLKNEMIAYSIIFGG